MLFMPQSPKPSVSPERTLLTLCPMQQLSSSQKHLFTGQLRVASVSTTQLNGAIKNLSQSQKTPSNVQLREESANVLWDQPSTMVPKILQLTDLTKLRPISKLKLTLAVQLTARTLSLETQFLEHQNTAFVMSLPTIFIQLLNFAQMPEITVNVKAVIKWDMVESLFMIIHQLWTSLSNTGNKKLMNQVAKFVTLLPLELLKTLIIMLASVKVLLLLKTTALMTVSSTISVALRIMRKIKISKSF